MLRLVVLALVVLVLGAAAVCGLQPRRVHEIQRPGQLSPGGNSSRFGARISRTGFRLELPQVAGPPRGTGRSCPKSGAWISEPGSCRLIGPPRASCERGFGLSG
jgi:hypothetical protein